MSVYDDEREQLAHLQNGSETTSPAESGEVDGQDKATHTPDQSSLSPDEIADRETGPATESGTDINSGEDGRQLYRKEQGGKGRGKSRNNRRTAAIIASVIVSSGIGLAVLTAPNIILNNLREMMTSRISQLQVYNQRKYRRSKITKFADLFSKDGRMGGKMITDMEAHGYKFRYDPNTKKVIGLTLPNGKESLIREAIGDHIDDYMEVRHPLRTGRWKTKRANALYRRFGISRSSIVRVTNEAIDNPDKELNKRVAQNTLGEPVDIKTNPYPVPKDETAAEKAAREAGQAAVDDASKVSGIMGNIRSGVLNGEDVGDLAKQEGIAYGADAIEQVATGAGDAVLNTASAIAAGSATTRIVNAFKNFLNPTSILDNVCTVKSRLRMSVTAARSYRALALLKYSSTFLGVADATRTNKVNPKLMSSLLKRVTAVDRSGNPIGASPGIVYALKGRFSKSDNDSKKGSYGVDGKLTGTWKGIEDATNNVPGTNLGQCGVIQNPVFQIGSTVVLTVGKAALCAVSIGTGCAAEEGAEVALQTAVKEAIKTSIQETITNVFTKQTARSLALSALSGITFDGILTLTQLYIEKSLALPFTTQEQGGELGSILVAGGGVANKQLGLQAGMVPATTDQYQKTEDEFVAWKKTDMSQHSFYARFLDTSNPDSLAFRAFTSIPMSMGSMVATIKVSVADMLSNVLSGRFITSFASGLLDKQVHADDEITHEQYVLESGAYSGKALAVDFAGNPQVTLRPDIEAVDPAENIQQLAAAGDIDPVSLEPTSERFRNHIANCIDTIDIISKIEFEDNPASPDHDCMAANPLTVRFKAHLAYLDMLDGIQAEFSPGEI